MTAWISVIAGLIPIIAFIIKYVLSEEAAKKAKEAQFQKENEAHNASVNQKVEEGSQAKPAESQGASNAWDASDAEMNK